VVGAAQSLLEEANAAKLDPRLTGKNLRNRYGRYDPDTSPYAAAVAWALIVVRRHEWLAVLDVARRRLGAP
jgi:hypothetical protein